VYRPFLLCCVVLSLLVAAPPAWAQGMPQWITLAPAPTSRYALAAATGPDGRIYTFGGYIGGPAYAAAEVYTPWANTWTAVSPLPTARSALAAAVGPDRRIYVLGGTGPCGSSCPTVEAYNTATNSWASAASLPVGRTELGAAVGADGRIYAVGGVSCPPTPAACANVVGVDAYAPVTNTWSPAAPLPTPRNDLAVVAGADGRIYAIGGIGDACSPCSTVEVYTPATNSWAEATPLPLAAFSLAAALGADGHIYAIGGSGNSPTGFLDTVQSYDPVSNRWSMRPSLPQPDQGLAATSGPSGTIYAIAGAACVNNVCGATNALHALFTSPGRSPAPQVTPRSPGPRVAAAQVTSRPPAARLPAGQVAAGPGWQDVAPLPAARTNLAAATGGDGRIYAAGGEVCGSVCAATATVAAYDSAHDQWMSAPAMPTARCTRSAAANSTGAPR